MYTICYSSKASSGVNERIIEDIFSTTLENNPKKQINGILLYGMGNFFQVLEGKKDTIESLYEDTIKNDPRHTEIFEIIRRDTDTPAFSNYSSTFTIVKTNAQLENIKSYLRLNRVHTTSEKLSRLLNPFLLDI